MERGPLSLVSIIEELLERKSRGSGLENLEYGIVRLRTQATEFFIIKQQVFLAEM
jgi:hypothetical protein